MRSYLIDHEADFKESLEQFERNCTKGPSVGMLNVPEGISHDVSLLYRWTYQVIICISNGLLLGTTVKFVLS